MCNTEDVTPAPDSLGPVCRGGPRLRGQGQRLRRLDLHRRRRAAPDGHQARSWASRTRTSSTSKQFEAAVDLLKEQKPAIGQYWVDYTEADGGVHEPGRRHRHDLGVSRTCCRPRIRRAGRGGQAQGGRDGLVGHLDDQLQGQAPQLRVQVIDHMTSPTANAAIAEWFGEAPGNSKACAETADPEPLRELPRRRRRLLEGRLVLADARDHVRRRPDRREVQGLRRLGQGLDGDQGLSDCSTHRDPDGGSPLGGPRPSARLSR